MPRLYAYPVTLSLVLSVCTSVRPSACPFARLFARLFARSPRVIREIAHAARFSFVALPRPAASRASRGRREGALSTRKVGPRPPRSVQSHVPFARSPARRSRLSSIPHPRRLSFFLSFLFSLFRFLPFLFFAFLGFTLVSGSSLSSPSSSPSPLPSPSPSPSASPSLLLFALSLLKIFALTLRPLFF